MVIIGVISVIYTLKSTKMIVMALTSLFTLGSGVLAWLKHIGYMNMMFDRMFKGDISTGRFGIWESYSEYLNRSPLTFFFGDGIGTNYLPIGGPHNTYIEAVFFVGILGSMFYLFMIVSILSHKKYNYKKQVINYLPLFVFLIMIGVLGCFTINEFSFYCMLVWLGLNIGITNKSRDFIEVKNTNVQYNSAGLQS